MDYRHGDLALIEIKELPSGLEEAKTKVIMKGSGGNEHTFDEGKLYFKNVNQFVFGYFVAGKGTKLYHVEHGKKIKGKKLKEAEIKNGIYELRRQCEETNEGMKPVVD